MSSSRGNENGSITANVAVDRVQENKENNPASVSVASRRLSFISANDGGRNGKAVGAGRRFSKDTASTTSAKKNGRSSIESVPENKTASLKPEVASEDDNIKTEDILKSKTFPNGTVVCMTRDGTRIQTTANGVKLLLYPDGRRVQKDGKTVIELLPDGTKNQRSLIDGTVLTLRPDGSQLQQRADGSRIEVSSNGVITDTRADGVVVRLFADGSKEQTDPDAPDVVLRVEGYATSTSGKKGGSKQVSDTGETKSDENMRPKQILLAMQDGSLIQRNFDGPWRLVIKDSSQNSTIQRGVSDQSFMYSTPDKKTLIQSKGGESLHQIVYDAKSDAVLLETDDVDMKLVEELEQKCKAAESHFNLSANLQEEKAQNMTLKQTLARTERMVVESSRSFEDQIRSQQTRLKEITEENNELKNQLGAQKSMIKKLKQKVKVQEKTMPLKEEATSPGKLSYSVSPTKSVATQWKVDDASENFYADDSFRGGLSDELNHDAELTKKVLDELNSQVSVLEHENQEMEDLLTDLRFSLQQGAEKKKKSKWHSVLVKLKVRGQQSQEVDSGALRRIDSVLASIDHKNRDRKSTFGSALKTSPMHSDASSEECERLRLQLSSALRERDEANDKCRKLEFQLSACGNSDEASESIGDNETDNGGFDSRQNSIDNYMGLLPTLEEQMQINLSLSTVSPMI